MPKCTSCLRKNHLMMKCKWCTIAFCPSCISYEVHSCSKIDDMRKFHLKTLEERLLNDKVDGVKLIKI